MRSHPSGSGTGRTVVARAAAVVLLAGAGVPLQLPLAPRAEAALPAYTASVRPIGAALAYRMRWSWRAGCPVPLSGLRYLRMTYYGFDGLAHTGEMVVNADVVPQVVTAFRRIYVARFPVYRMRLVDDYRGSDAAVMAANDTSAFNCRRVTGGTSWSQHSYGRAVDLNPVQNPYVKGTTVEPTAGRSYVTRSPLRKGMVNSAVRSAFSGVGWSWGGRWITLKDYMHFSRNGR